MAKRCDLLGGEFDGLYSFHYAEFSWYVHSGVIGVANVDQDTIAHLCGVAFQVIVMCYGLILEAIINCFQMYNADDRLKKKIVLARMLPFTDSERERAARRECPWHRCRQTVQLYRRSRLCWTILRTARDSSKERVRPFLVRKSEPSSSQLKSDALDARNR